jgi:hypothetical protein
MSWLFQLHDTHLGLDPAGALGMLAGATTNAFAAADSWVSWFPSWTGQGTAPASRRRDDGDEGVPAVDGEAEG